MNEGAEPLHGQRVLVVEDRYLIASDVAEQIRRLGGRVVGPAPNLEKARRALAQDGADLAILDINLDGGDVYPLAAELEETGVPFLFLTGYDVDVLPPKWRVHLRLAKPINVAELRDKLCKLVETSGGSGVSA